MCTLYQFHMKRVAGHLLSQFCGETITEEVVRKQYPSSGHGTGTWKDIVSIIISSLFAVII